MADYFTRFSLVVRLPSQAAQQYAVELAAQAKAVQDEAKLPHQFPASLANVVEDWQFNTEIENPPGLCAVWLHSENGGLDAVCAFIQHLLEKFDPQGRVTFEWSHDCSKPRVDAYGGGAAIITARKIKTISTGQWLHKHAA